MADRTGGEGDPGVPKEVFELDKDERWQARLDEARARREVALREKAAGKPQKPRPKPWEIEGAAVEKPPKIDPIIQERGDDKFDFADRLETIREPKEKPAAPKPARKAPERPPAAARPVPVPPSPPPQPSPPPPASAPPQPSPPSQMRAPAPEPRARPQPSLILPGAPDVADLAARYAATLDSADRAEARSPEPVPDEPEPVGKTADLVALPTAKLPPEFAEAQPDPDAPLSRAERRRGIRPLGMAFGLIALAALPLTTEAPPLETGPAMPVVDVLRIQPALGVTWSLYEPPFQTRAGEWVPGRAPSRLGPMPFSPPVSPLDSVALPPDPVLRDAGAIAWTEAAPVARSAVPGFAVPAGSSEALPFVADAPQRAVIQPETATPEPSGDVSAPPRPATLRDEPAEAPPAPAARPDTASAADPFVEADPLRVTILAPARVDPELAETIASGVTDDGHDLVRIRDVDFSISERNVRYFHDADRASAARMAERYDAELRDFTWFRPRPVEGTAELWLAGRAPGGNTGGRQQPVPSGGGAADRGDLLGRVFDRLGLGTELPDALPGADGLRAVLPDAEESGN